MASVEGRGELGTVLFGTAEKLRDELGFDMLPYNRADYADRREGVLPELGEDRFEAAWARGQRMDVDAAYKLVVSEWNQ